MESDKTVSAISHGFGGESVSRARSNNGRTSGPTRRSTKGQWTPEEDEILCKAVQKYKGKNWKKIAECFKDRTDVQCLHRWQKVLNPDLIKGPWSKEEDEIIIQLVNKYGPKKWSLIAQHLPGRIGKQCRERWHNHLNPAINKEAWTQEEELVLIRAHQTFGNRWAELTKFLPGRSDNAIKNHWNSSVKKKLDSYMASGLLSQLPPLPMPQNQPMPTSSSRKLNNGYGSVPSGAEAEEMSECSQESEIVACSQSRSEMTNLVLEAKEEMQWTEDNGLGKEHSLSFLPHIMRYYPLDDINISIPERSSEVGCSSKHLEQNFPNNIESFAGRICQFDMHQLPDISSLQLGLESSGFPMQCTDMNRNQESTNILFQNSAGMFSKSMEAIAMGSDKLEHMIMSDDEFCRVLFSDERNDGGSSYSNVPKDTNMAELGGCSDSSLSQSATIQNLELYGHTESEAVGTCHQSCQPAPSLLSNDDNALIANRVSEDLHKIYEEEITTMPHDVISNINDCSYSSHDGGAESTSMHEQLDVINDPPKLVPVNSFSPQLDNVQICPSPDKKPDSTTGQQEGGFLCYEPPRFPSLDIPVFSCDLIQSGGEMQQDYSPLGIRKLMSSMDCMSPFKLWDSPSRDDNPIAVLKSAAKTFKGTPSILKKRSRDLLSPLSDRRLDKKLGTDWTKNFSHLDVIYDENGFYRTSRLPLASPLRMISETLTEGKKELCHPDDIGKDKGRDNFALLSGRLLEKDFENCAGKQGTTEDCENGKLDADTAVHAVQKPSEVLREHDVNDIQLHSPNKVCCGTIGSLIHGTPKSPLCQNSLVSSKRSINVQKFSSGKSHLLPGSSSRLCRKSAAVTSSHTISTSTPLEIRVDNSRKETCSEAFSIFGDTPFKRSIESPSAWKSPWFFNSFFSFPGIEDMDCYISPGNRSYDALGLMKQISEHTAASYAEAQELLGNETPEKLSDDRCFLNQSVSLQNEQSPRNCSSLNPKFQTECRTLDFSGCETPGKGAEHEISSSSLAYSSPSSYLLKACR